MVKRNKIFRGGGVCPHSLTHYFSGGSAVGAHFFVLHSMRRTTRRITSVEAIPGTRRTWSAKPKRTWPMSLEAKPGSIRCDIVRPRRKRQAKKPAVIRVLFVRFRVNSWIAFNQTLALCDPLNLRTITNRIFNQEIIEL
jgi:hypothetical protein